MKVILTGATGMVGEGVLLECLANPLVEKVLSISRKPSRYHHAKLEEYLVSDFLMIATEDERLKGYDACFFCAGISSIGMKEAAYTQVTFTLTTHVAQAVIHQNPALVFIYVSGAGTDSTEQSRLMWARVKGRTENTLAAMPFKKVYHFRPAFMKASAGQRHLLPAYKYFAWLFPLLKIIMPNSVSTLQQVALAMIHAVHQGYPKTVLEVKDIKILAEATD